MIGGMRLEGKKESSTVSWTIRHPRPPARIYIPLSQHQGKPALPSVQIGSHVRIGEKIAEPCDFSSVAIHTPISGMVAAIHSFPHPILGETDVIEITGDGREEKFPGIGTERNSWASLPRETLAAIFQDSGLVELSLNMKPLHVEIANSEAGQIKTLLLNGCESEPYVTADHALMMSHTLEILKGAEILRRAHDAERILIAVEDNKLEVAELLKSKIYFLKWEHIEIKILPSRYPQGSEISLIHTLMGLDIAACFNPSESGVQVYNIATAFAVYEAIVLQKPLYERVMTIGGECVMEPKNLWIGFGTTFEDAIKACRGLMREPRKLLMGGPMTGIAQKEIRVPAIKGTQAILALPKEVAVDGDEEACIRCGLCVEACPAEISPVMITLASEKGLFERARNWGLNLCFECGNCAYVCPAKRPMMELITHARLHLEETAFFEDQTTPQHEPFRAVQKLRKKKELFAETDVSV